MSCNKMGIGKLGSGSGIRRKYRWTFEIPELEVGPFFVKIDKRPTLRIEEKEITLPDIVNLKL